MAEHPQTPDGRYFVVRERLWRCSDPTLTVEHRQQLVDALMDARRAVKLAKAANDPDQLLRARQQVDQAKVALGERGPVWWSDGAPDYNRKLVTNSPYHSWYQALKSGA